MPGPICDLCGGRETRDEPVVERDGFDGEVHDECADVAEFAAVDAALLRRAR